MGYPYPYVMFAYEQDGRLNAGLGLGFRGLY